MQLNWPTDHLAPAMAVNWLVDDQPVGLPALLSMVNFRGRLQSALFGSSSVHKTKINNNKQQQQIKTVNGRHDKRF